MAKETVTRWRCDWCGITHLDSSSINGTQPPRDWMLRECDLLCLRCQDLRKAALAKAKKKAAEQASTEQEKK